MWDLETPCQRRTESPCAVGDLLLDFPLMRRRKDLVVGLALWAVVLAAPGAALPAVWNFPPSPQPLHKLVWANLLTGRYNPLGAEDRIELEYRLRLIDSRSVLWNDTYLGLGFTPAVTPVMSRIGATLTVKPIAVATLSASYNYDLWYGVLDNLQPFSGADDDFSDPALDRSGDRAISTTGHELVLRATLAGKLGPLAVGDTVEFSLTRMDLEGGGPYYYNIKVDALVRNGGWFLTNDTDIVFVTRFGLVAGARNTLTHAFAAEGAGPGAQNTPTDRLGPLLAYVFFDRPGRGFNKPTILLVVAWWLEHRFRTGEDVPQAVPYVVLGFKCEGELWRSEE
jgi:hypothetical protein